MTPSFPYNLDVYDWHARDFISVGHNLSSVLQELTVPAVFFPLNMAYQKLWGDKHETKVQWSINHLKCIVIDFWNCHEKKCVHVVISVICSTVCLCFNFNVAVFSESETVFKWDHLKLVGFFFHADRPLKLPKRVRTQIQCKIINCRKSIKYCDTKDHLVYTVA